ncbi:anaphase-promoting complex subunit 10 [Podospora aff. communis PSN243]|uniref:Anaphase-promoting complex subunit 10 n=1 Tax=Podospora aff. communis PSN243 TaxID=3040156 RepID=A0AAV9H652_9PEZI|nr:anaphase-promoting complex subunit 10 [Podospora aff. communis PSN243]
MSFTGGKAAPCPRRVLGELDPNRDLNTPRGRTKRAPIAWATENEDAVLDGVRDGTYDIDEVHEYTNYRAIPASVGDLDDDEEDDDDDLVRPLGAPFPAGAGAGEESDDEDDLDADFGAHDDELMGEMMDDDVDEPDDHEPADDDEHLQGPMFDPAAIGLREINNLAHFGVSSHKPGNGVDQLLSDDLDQYWQSDGQQPHLLTIHFLRRVEIRALRFYVDYSQDESYTPTHIVFYAGTGPHDLIQFAEVPLTNPVGWQDVPIADCGGGPDGHSLCCMIVQMHIKENHQNGKDTHIRGIKIFGLDENNANITYTATMDEEGNYENADPFPGADESGHIVDPTIKEIMDALDVAHSRFGRDDGFGPDFMNEPQIR